MKKVSIIVPSFNKEQFVVETLNSVLNQSYKHIELIVVDDGSTDNSLERIKSIQDGRIRLFQNDHNLGIPETLNKGLQEATGEYVCFCGCDDLFENEKIELQVKYLEQNPSTLAVLSQAQLIDNVGNDSFSKGRPDLENFNSIKNKDRHQWLRSFFVYDNTLCASSIMCQRIALEEFGGFDTRLTLLQDLDLYVYLCSRGNIYVYPERLVKYRLSPGNVSSLTVGNVLAHMHEKVLVLQRYTQLGNVELTQAFPELNPALLEESTFYDRIYSIALFAYQLGTNVHQLFAIRILTDNLINQDFSNYVREKFNFTSTRLHKMLSTAGIFNMMYLRIFLITRMKRVSRRMINKAIMLITKSPRDAYRAFQAMLLRVGLFGPYVFIKNTLSRFMRREGVWTMLALRVYRLSMMDVVKFYKSTFTSVYLPCYSEGHLKDKRRYSQPSIFKVDFDNVEVVGGLSYIIKGSKAHIDLHNQIGFERVSLLNDLVLAQNNNEVVLNCREQECVINQGVMLCGTASSNYFHWLTEFIPKLSLFSKTELNSLNFILDEDVVKCAPLFDSFRTLVTNNNYTTIKRSYKYSVNKLTYPSLLSWTTINLKPGYKLEPFDCIISKQAVRFLRKSYLSKAKPVGKRRIFISRTNSTNRKYNEEAILPIIQKYGFEVCAPEKLTFSQQVKLFSEASHIIGATGGGMTNIVFAPAYAKILCLISSQLDFTGFSTIAGILGQDMIFLGGKMAHDKRIPYEYQNGFTVDVKSFESAVLRLVTK